MTTKNEIETRTMTNSYSTRQLTFSDENNEKKAITVNIVEVNYMNLILNKYYAFEILVHVFSLTDIRYFNIIRPLSLAMFAYSRPIYLV